MRGQRAEGGCRMSDIRCQMPDLRSARGASSPDSPQEGSPHSCSVKAKIRRNPVLPTVLSAEKAKPFVSPKTYNTAGGRGPPCYPKYLNVTWYRLPKISYPNTDGDLPCLGSEK
jgi:hypothetical protein